MKGSRAADYNQTSREADTALANYTAGDYNALGKIARAIVQVEEIVRRDETVNIANRESLQRYFNGIYKKDPCLVLKADKVYEYTRNNVCKCVRGKHEHTHEFLATGSKNQIKKRALFNFIDENPMDVLFAVMSQWVKTPYVQFTNKILDSDFPMKEKYTNLSGRTTQIGVVESIIFNIQDEIAHIINNGKIGWTHNKVIWPLVPSHRNDLGDTLFDKIKESFPHLKAWNPSSKI